jgi:Ca2+-binding RTX toxin-like protein
VRLGLDVLRGGDGSDRLVGGATLYADNHTALDAIMAKWGRTDIGYDQRISHICQGRGLNDVLAMNKDTVLDDGAADLSGGDGMDWFVVANTKVIPDLADGERIR